MSNGKAIFVYMQSQIESMNYISSSFDPSGKQAYQLYIDGSVGGDPLLLFLDEQHRLQAVLSYSQFHANYEQKSLDSVHLDKVTLIIPALDLILIPDVAYDPALQEEYAHHLLDDGISETRVIDFMELKAKGVYRENLLPIVELARMFPQAERKLLQHGLLETLSQKLNTGESADATILGVHLMGEQVFFYLFKEGVLTYFNDYQILDKNQLNYHLIKVAELSKADIHQIDLFLSGTVMPNDWVHQEVKDYFKTTQFRSKPDGIQVVLPEDFKESEHRLLGFYSTI